MPRSCQLAMVPLAVPCGRYSCGAQRMSKPLFLALRRLLRPQCSPVGWHTTGALKALFPLLVLLLNLHFLRPFLLSFHLPDAPFCFSALLTPRATTSIGDTLSLSMPTRRALQLDFVTFALVCLLFSLVVSASLVNITVDDSEFNNGVPRITYTPLNSWHIGEDCLTCTAHPNPDEAFAGTWHDSTFLRGADEHDIKTASLEFNGSAIYVYCITTGSYIKPLGNSEMSFFIDGDLVGSLSQTANGNTNYSFNVLVYSNDSMPAGVHSFTMRNGLVGGLESLLLLDYIIYSQDSDAPLVAFNNLSATTVSNKRFLVDEQRHQLTRRIISYLSRPIVSIGLFSATTSCH
ncbi:hypothetical protein BC835DRAFT_416635 [Cytidiella melzeri]|nr:hypothetical protein BC835DRAFT_416635 [Cytidiella melzeri]